MDEPLIRVENVTKSFGEGEAATLVLKGINLAIGRGELVALVGPSGSGKSTLLNILGLLMRPTTGHYEMLGKDLLSLSESELTAVRNRHLGFVFQFHHLLPDLSAIENVMMPAACSAGRETAPMRDRARQLLDAVGLSHRLNYRPHALSGGQRQRTAVARSLINQPDLVLADEPTGNLDSESAGQVMDLIEQINRDTATSFLISTHDEKIASRCQRRIVILDGRVRSS